MISKIIGYKMNMQNSIVFYTLAMNDSNRKIKKTILFAIPLERIKYRGTHFIYFFEERILKISIRLVY